MKIYVEAKSKADLIRRLSAGEEITGYNYSMFGGGGHYMLDNTLEDGTIIAIYSQMSQGNPVAKSWGTWTNGVLKAETFESPVSCKICGKTFASFRGLNGHMNAHIPTHRKRAEECEHEWKMMELPLERGHKYDVGWVNAAGITSYHMVCSKCNYCTECSGTHGFLAETFEAPYAFNDDRCDNCERSLIDEQDMIRLPIYIDDSEYQVCELCYGELIDTSNDFGQIYVSDPDKIPESYSAEGTCSCRMVLEVCDSCQQTNKLEYSAEGDEPTIEDFFVDMSDLLTTYSGGDWDWDSEARDGVLEFSGHLTPINGSNFYQYDLDFDEMREDETFDHPPSIESTSDTHKNNLLKVVGAVVIGLFIGRNL